MIVNNMIWHTLTMSPVFLASFYCLFSIFFSCVKYAGVDCMKLKSECKTDIFLFVNLT